MLAGMKTDKFFLHNDKVAWTQKRGSAWQKRRHTIPSNFFVKSSLYLMVVFRFKGEHAETISRRKQMFLSFSGHYNVWNFALLFIMIFCLYILSWFPNLAKLKFSLSKFRLCWTSTINFCVMFWRMYGN